MSTVETAFDHMLLLKMKYAYVYFITFRMRRSRGEMHICHGRLCVCVSVCLTVPCRILTPLHRPGCNLGNGRNAL